MVMVAMTAVPAAATSVGSPKTQGRGKIAVAPEWSYVFGRSLDFEKAARPAGHEVDRPENFRIDKGYNLTGKTSYGLFDFMDIYVKLGIARYDLKGDVLVGDNKRVEEKLSARHAFLYGGGLKLAYELKKGWIIGCDAQYLTSHHVVDFGATNTISGAVTNAKYYDCRIQEWHAAPYVARRIAGFTPYIGGRYSDLRLDQKRPSDPRRWSNLVFSAEYNIGIFTGMDWNLGSNLKFNVEGRFVDETAISVGAEYRF